jgi:uncharacterized membrane protein
MSGTLNTLFVATVAFVGGHFVLSSIVVRRRLIRMLGEGGFMPAYTLVIASAFIWMIAAYRVAPIVPVWEPPLAFAWIPLVLMPIAIFLAVAGLTTRGPTQIGAERLLDTDLPHNPAPGIISITRHPFLWGTALWAVTHLMVNGELANITVMGGILILSVGGMMHIDQRREDAMGATWGPVKLTTSLIPFAAILTKRTHLDWRGIGWWRPLAAVAIYLLFLQLHAWALGVSPWPV